MRSRRKLFFPRLLPSPLVAWFICWLSLPALLFTAPVPTNKPAHYPTWWFERDVLKRLNPADPNPIWPASYKSSDDYGVSNIGQAKHIAAKAREEFNAVLPGGAGSAIKQMVDKWSQPPAPGTPARDDFSGIALGQLKTVAKPFYDRLIQLRYASGYPWTATTADDDSYALGNIGQLKKLFSFDLRRDSDGDGLPDLWERNYVLARSGGGGGGNPDTDADSYEDSDGDGLSNYGEFGSGTDANDSDTDNDGMPDGEDPEPLIPNPLAALELQVVVPDTEAEPYVADPDRTKVEVRWKSPGDPSISQYIVERMDTLNPEWKTIGSVGPGTFKKTDQGLLSLTVYSYRVISRNAQGARRISETINYEVPLIRATWWRVSINEFKFPGPTEYYTGSPGILQKYTSSIKTTTEKRFLRVGGERITGNSRSFSCQPSNRLSNQGLHYWDPDSNSDYTWVYRSPSGISLTSGTFAVNSDWGAAEDHESGTWAVGIRSFAINVRAPNFGINWTGTCTAEYGTLSGVMASDGDWVGSYSTNTFDNVNPRGGPDGTYFTDGPPADDEFTEVSATTGRYYMERTEHGLPHSETEITWALEGLYSTGAMIADAAMQMPPHPEEWGMGYPQWSGTWGYWGGQTHKWVGPTVNLTRFEIAARNLDSNERQIDLKKGEYKFTFFPSARDIEFNVWEQFTPEDDPSIPNFDESTQITITPREVRASAGTETSNVYPVAVPATDGKVTVGTSPIEILNLDGGDASHGINIASWQKAYLKPGRFPPELKADFPNDDPSSFRIRVKKFKVSDSADLKPTVKIATESPDAQYSDSLSEIEMFTDTAAPEYWTSHPQMLVSDQNDDVYSENGAGADESLADRTHRAKLGSKVKVEVTRAGSTTKKEVRVPAPSHHIKRVALHVVIMRNKPEANGGVFPTTRERVEADIRAVNERFAPAGVLFTIADWEWSDPPGGVDLALGVIADKVVGDFYETFLIGEYFGRRLPSEVFVIYINNFLKADKTLAALMGLTYPGMNFILMGSQADSLLVAHELGHNFAWGAAPGNGPDDHASTDYMENVMYHGMHPVSPSNVSLRKRFNAEQITRIRQDPRAR